MTLLSSTSRSSTSRYTTWRRMVMGPHPAFRESMTTQRVEALRGSAVAPKRAVRRRVGLVLLALGERLTAEAHATRAPRPALGQPLHLLEAQRRRVDAVALARGMRPVRENVSEVAAAARAHDLGA